MKYCTKCGNQLNDDDVFCPKCGHRQNEVREDETPVVEASAPKADGRVGIRDFTMKGTIAYASIYVVFFIVNTILLYALDGYKDQIPGRIAYLVIPALFLAVNIMRLVHAINVKNKKLIITQAIILAVIVALYFASFLISLSID